MSKPAIQTQTSSRQTDLGRRVLSLGADIPEYSVRLAASADDVKAAQTLRFFVFNLELKEGLESSFLTFRDEDAYDAVCDHLVVEFQGEVVGTYRMQTGSRAAAHIGFYCAQEFDLTRFDPIRSQILELGRACVHQDHRNVHVLSMLWRGIAAYARTHSCRYLLGCSSLTSQNPAEGISLYQKLFEGHSAPLALRTNPLPGWECSLDESIISPEPFPKPPKLLRAYLSLGAKICAPPALDREFGTIDFLTLLDLEDLPQNDALF